MTPSIPVVCYLVSNDNVALSVGEATAALRGIPTDHSPAELRRRVELAHQQDWTCTWCGQPLLPADIGAGRTQVDHVIPLIRGGPREPWNRELLHSNCNGSKGRRMTDRAWALARQHDIDAVPPHPAALRNAVRAAANDVRRIRRAMADFDAAGMEIADDVELDNLLAELHAVADEVADARRNPPTVLHSV